MVIDNVRSENNLQKCLDRNQIVVHSRTMMYLCHDHFIIDKNPALYLIFDNKEMRKK